jgi:hypothetical protein
VELPHLVPARQLSVTPPVNGPPPAPRRRVRALVRSPLLHFFALGLLALLAERALSRADAPRPALTVVVPSGLTDEERDVRVDAAILVEEAIALGWPRTDPVIRARLIENLRFARGQQGTPPSANDLGLLEEALRLDMHRTDLIVRRRMVMRAERMLASDVRNAPVDDATLLAFRDAHPERFRAPARFRYSDLFLGRQQRGEALATDVSAMQRRLAAGGVTPAEAGALGDPLLYSPGDRLVSADEVARRLGGALSQQLTEAPLETWAGPFESSFGYHFVWVHERREAALPSLDDSRARVLGAYRDARQAEALRARMAELRAGYDIHVEVREGAP